MSLEKALQARADSIIQFFNKDDDAEQMTESAEEFRARVIAEVLHDVDEVIKYELTINRERGKEIA